MAIATTSREALSTEFSIDVDNRSPGPNKPQRMGGRLWLPMFALAITAFVVAFVISAVQAGELSENGVSDTTEALNHVKAAVMFIGFASVFSAIIFAIARILGVFRSGGGDVQEASGNAVHTMKMPASAKAMMAGMLAGMMLILIPVVLHFAFAADVTDTVGSLEESEQRFIVLEGVRRLGVAVYLTSIAFGLATIIKVLRFQAIRIRELAR